MNLNHDKAIRLLQYIQSVTADKQAIIKNVDNYDDLIWLADIPHHPNCLVKAWAATQDQHHKGSQQCKPTTLPDNIWIEVKNENEPLPPPPPPVCKGWFDETSLTNKNNPPVLYQQRHMEHSDQNKTSSETELLTDHPEIQQAWEHYIATQWSPWCKQHDDWETVYKVYAHLFTIRQNMLRSSENYTLSLGVGLLHWQPSPDSPLIKKHLLVADVIIEFEPTGSKFMVRPHPEGTELRLELDVLDTEWLNLIKERDLKTELEAWGSDDIWNRERVSTILKKIAHSLHPQGRYIHNLQPPSNCGTGAPRIIYAPALIMRKRSNKGLASAIRQMKKQLEKGVIGANAFLQVTDPSTDNYITTNNVDDTQPNLPQEIYFPKPYNEEQLSIVRMLSKASGVVVQGPPGTGKSHTIANLICHLLATGKRVLVTAKTQRALKVLERLIPDSLKPLCVNLVGDSVQDHKACEASIRGMFNKKYSWHEQDEARNRDDLQQRIYKLRQEEAKLNNRLLYIREQETIQHDIADGYYRGTAEKIAQKVKNLESKYNWLTDEVPLNRSCPITGYRLTEIVNKLRDFRPKQYIKDMKWPEDLPSYSTFKSWVDQEERAYKIVRFSEKDSDEIIIQILLHDNVTYDDLGRLSKALDSYLKLHDEVMQQPFKWIKQVVSDINCGNHAHWDKRLTTTQDLISEMDPLLTTVEAHKIDLPIEVTEEVLLEGALKVHSHLENKGRLGWGPPARLWPFRPEFIKEHQYLLKVQLNGSRCDDNLSSWATVCKILQFRVALKKAWREWSGIAQYTDGPYPSQLRKLHEIVDALQRCLQLAERLDECKAALKSFAKLNQPNWNNPTSVQNLKTSCEVAMARRIIEEVRGNIDALVQRVSCLEQERNVHPITTKLLEAIRKRDIQQYNEVKSTIDELQKARQEYNAIQKQLTPLRKVLPRLVDAIITTPESKHWDERLPEIEEAWRWAQARNWLRQHILDDNLEEITKRISQIGQEIRYTLANLAANLAWSHFFSRLTSQHHKYMEAWMTAIRSVGKGTGKHAERKMREAQTYLNHCREAIPAWIMPIHRIWHTISPKPEIFDVIIVDEASQCGLESLPLLYLGKKIIIVGDDKQISPDYVGSSRNVVHSYKDKYLRDFQFKDIFNLENSLFDYGNVIFNTCKVTLREHFRCMPEIIQFSNQICYTDTPLIPLRQYGANRLPPLKHVFVESGFREGTSTNAINRPEAEKIVETIAKLCQDKRYTNKTMGVISLQGKAQAILIEKLLLDRLGAHSIHERQIICGNPHDFQGDERDVIFLSMVAAPNQRIASFNRYTYEQRFNVAVSRARDQVWLFYSIQLHYLRPDDVRHKLISFFRTNSTKPKSLISQIDQNELERRALRDDRRIMQPPQPFESWFEVDVALELLRRGYLVIPQFEVAGRRIDLVVQGAGTRLAVECDGDYWHGIDRYEYDMARQRQLERCGWEFFRVLGSAFYLDKNATLNPLWTLLERRGIFPQTNLDNCQEEETDVIEAPSDFAVICPDEGTESQQQDKPVPSPPSKAVKATPAARSPKKTSSRRPKDITNVEIEAAIITALSKQPNRTCTIKSITSKTLKELNIRTRGKPYQRFDRRVREALQKLEERKIIEFYKATNPRIRLLKPNHA